MHHDIFHQKITITNESILCVNWFFSELDKICKTFVVIGNHDFLMNNTGRVDSLSPLFEIGSYKQVYFLDKELDYKSGIYKDDNGNVLQGADIINATHYFTVF